MVFLAECNCFENIPSHLVASLLIRRECCDATAAAAAAADKRSSDPAARGIMVCRLLLNFCWDRYAYGLSVKKITAPICPKLICFHSLNF